MKKMTVAAIAAAMLGAGLSTAPEVVNNQMAQEGISQQIQRTATHQNQNQKAPEQRTYQRTNDIYNMPGGDLFSMKRSWDIGPKEYGQMLQRTGRQWSNMRERRSRKYRR